MKDMTIGIVGNGVVGHATARAWIEHVKEVHVYDIMPERCVNLPSDFRHEDRLDVLRGCDLIFLCLPEDQLEPFFEDKKDKDEWYFPRSAGKRTWPECNLVIKSTVPIGTTRELAKKHGLKNICHSPEFLTSRCAVTDAQMPARNVIGHVPTKPNREVIEDDLGTLYINYPVLTCARQLKRLYEERFPSVPVHCMTSDESEAVKLMTNAFFACKIAVMNEFRALSDSLELDWDRVLGGILADGRISHSHTSVPGHDGFGFAGSCLPKDLRTLVESIEGEGLLASMTRAALERNKEDRERKAR